MKKTKSFSKEHLKTEKINLNLNQKARNQVKNILREIPAVTDRNTYDYDNIGASDSLILSHQVNQSLPNLDSKESIETS